VLFEDGRCLDIGTPDDLMRAGSFVASCDEEFSATGLSGMDEIL
jgi:hypothetical protein